MNSAMKLWISLLVLGVPAVAAAAPDLGPPQPFFQTYCVSCHGAEKQKGGVRLDDAAGIDADLWQNVYRQLASQEMPPDDKPRPTADERRGLMHTALARATERPAIATTGFRRLNQREYGNTVRDLLGLRQGTFDPGEYIYKDEVSAGFDTEAASLVISHELLLEYLRSAEKSLRRALFTTERTRPPARIIDVNLAKMTGTSRRYINVAPGHAITRSAGRDKLYDGESTRTMRYPGRYTITVTASGTDRDRYPVRFEPEEGPLIMGIGVMADSAESLALTGVLQQTFKLKDDVEQTFTFDTWIDKGHFPYLSFVNGSDKPITQVRATMRRGLLKDSADSEPYVGPGVRVSRFTIAGPYFDEWPAGSLRAVYAADQIPDLDDAAARAQVLERFATRAFRRPVTTEEMIPYVRFLEARHAASQDWAESLLRTLAAMMSSADFLYLREEGGELAPHALASRLSYFLWSTMPDAELTAHANSGNLTEPAVLRKQVARMLEDPRADQFSRSFADQWLALRTLGSMPPDVKSPDFRIYFRRKLEPAMRTETALYFRHVLRENRSVRDFIDSDYSILNAGLAELYEVPFPGGDEFTRVTFPSSARRGGILGHGSVLTLSANGVETSPVQRGHWVLKHFLGTPPPPPPKEVPALVPDLNGLKTVRELLAKHRSDAACLECHRQMDPLGFALEAYDPIGRLRSSYSKTMPVSTEGDFKGKPFNDVAGLKQIMLTQLRPFARNLVLRIAEYAKGRKLVAADFKTVEDILDRSAADEFRLKDLVTRIATSDLLTRR